MNVEIHHIERDTGCRMDVSSREKSGMKIFAACP
jgi:hypothetical protein